MSKETFFHSSSIRFALALWAASVLAFYIAYFVQLEPAQWVGITVWIMFIQTPRLNYGKLLYWSLGTVGGALYAVALISICDQSRLLFLVGLILCLSACAFVANLVRSYNAYGAVLFGYTANIVSMSAVDHPSQVFDLAVNRMSCIFIGMAAAVLAMMVFLPRHPHWKETLLHLTEFSREVFARATTSLRVDSEEKDNASSWARVSDHLSLLEHTLAPTTAETAASRLRVGPARQAVASLFCLLAKSQSIDECLARRNVSVPDSVRVLMADAHSLFAAHFTDEPETIDQSASAFQRLRVRVRRELAGFSESAPAVRFILLRLDEMLADAENVLGAFKALQQPQGFTQPARLKIHHDTPTAWMAALRMALAMTMASIVWVATGWPSGSQFVLLTGVISSLLTLQEDPRHMGWNFLISACLCTAVSFIDVYWILQKGEGFFVIALALGLFLVPAAYFYRKPSLVGAAVPSMLIFYGLVGFSNQMTYDISLFLNNAVGFICATGLVYFTFHAVLPPPHPARCLHLLRNVWRDIEEMDGGCDPLREQGWVSLVCDRIRLLHHFGAKETRVAHEREARLGLQLGLRRLRLQSLFLSTAASDLRSLLKPVLKLTRKLSTSPDSLILAISRACGRLERSSQSDDPIGKEVLAELFEMKSLLQSHIPET
jgi:uncharacterized membrane protein YccC